VCENEQQQQSALQGASSVDLESKRSSQIIIVVIIEEFGVA